MPRFLLLLAVALAAVLAAAAPAPAASIWTPIDSGQTTGAITAIEYQGPDRFWYATSNGKLARRVGGTFQFGTGAGLDGTITFNDIAFQPASDIGLAVGNSDQIWRTADGGATWSRLDPRTFSRQFSTCGTGTKTENVQPGDVYAVAWGTGGVAYMAGQDRMILRSQDNGLTWTEVNKRPGAEGGCSINADINDLAVLAGGPAQVDEKLYLMEHGSFAGFYYSADGLTSTASRRGEMVNTTDPFNHFAYDPDNPNRVFAIGRCGFTCWTFSEDGGANRQTIHSGHIPNHNDRRQENGYDVAFAGGTVVMVMNAGQILTSIDGKNYFYQYAEGALETRDWRSVDSFDARHAAIGGVGGALLVSDRANEIPDVVAPTLSIQGPASGSTSAPVTFTALASDNPGGSGIDPASYEWTVSGLPPATGASATFHFPSAGSYTVRATVRDLAGNRSEVATHVISISAGTPPAARLEFPGGRGVSAKLAGKSARVKASGAVVPPPGADPARACTGKVVVTVRKTKGKKKLASRSADVRPDCTFRTTAKVARKKLRGARKVKVTLRFTGNAVLGAKSTSLVVKLRR